MCPFIVPCGNGAVLLEFGEEVLNQVPGLIHVFIVVALLRAMCFGRDDGCDAGFRQQVEDSLLRMVGLIRQKCLYCGKNTGQQDISSFEIVHLSRREMESCGVAQCIATCMDFRDQLAF